MVLDHGWSRRFDHRPTDQRMKLASLLGGVGLDGVRQPWSSKVKEKHQKRSKANTAEEGKERVKGSDGAVHVAVDVASHDEHGDLRNEEADDDQPEHRANGVPRR